MQGNNFIADGGISFKLICGHHHLILDNYTDIFFVKYMISYDQNSLLTFTQKESSCTYIGKTTSPWGKTPIRGGGGGGGLPISAIKFNFNYYL